MPVSSPVQQCQSVEVWREVEASVNQSINFIDERVKKTTDIVTKINTNYATFPLPDIPPKPNHKPESNPNYNPNPTNPTLNSNPNRAG